MLVDLINNLHFLAEDKESVLNSVAEKVRSMDKAKLMKTVQEHAGVRTQSFFEKLFRSEEMKDAV